MIYCTFLVYKVAPTTVDFLPKFPFNNFGGVRFKIYTEKYVLTWSGCLVYRVLGLIDTDLVDKKIVFIFIKGLVNATKA